jgi:hypothetical protein
MERDSLISVAPTASVVDDRAAVIRIVEQCRVSFFPFGHSGSSGVNSQLLIANRQLLITGNQLLRAMGRFAVLAVVVRFQNEAGCLSISN